MEHFFDQLNFTHFEDLSRIISSNQFKLRGREREVNIFRCTLILTTAVLSVVCLVGSIGNALVIYVFSQRLRQGVSNLFITLLAIIDLVICLVDIPATLYWTVWQRDSVDLVCKIHTTLKAFFIPFSASILVLIAVDRFLLICFVPGIKLKPRTTSVSLFLVFLFGICLAVPCGLHTGVHDGIEISDTDILVNPLSTGSNSSIFDIERFTNALKLNVSDGSARGGDGDLFSVQASTIRFGPCQPDETYITNSQYKHYTLSIFGVFVMMFITLTVLYSITFSFIWWRQHMRIKRYGGGGAGKGGRNALLLKYKSKLKVESNDITSHNNSLHLKKSSDSTSCCDVEAGRREINNSPTSTGRTNQTTAIGVKEEEPNTMINSPVMQTSAQLAEASKEIICHAEVNHKRRKPHIRTAQTLALVTFFFIFSYMPYLLIINEFIWPEPILQLAQFNHHREATLSQHLKRLFFFMYFVNSSINPIIYSCLNQTFRTDVISLLRRLHIIK